MQPVVALELLDEILSLQLLMAWAGEAPGGAQPRLGWWNTDVIDEEGGGDLWKRLLPRTDRWAGLDAARRAARLTDDRLRRENARADDMVTLFHFGFELDEALDERLAHHKLEARAPAEVLPLLSSLTVAFDSGALLKQLSDPSELDFDFKVVPGGRQLKTVPDDGPAVRARQLACAMLQDPPSAYPLPFFLIEAPRAER